MLKNLTAALLLTVLVALPCSVSANPVSFKDGWGVMPTYASKWSDVSANYSMTAKDSAGVAFMHRRGESKTASFYFADYNRLLKRWNEADSQANIYIVGGIGMRHENDGDEDPAAHAGMQADYETRQLYTQLSGETLRSPEGVNFNRLRTRAGFAPHRAEIDQLQLWIVGQLDYMPEMEERVTLTPFIRLFYNNIALEFGSSTKGEIMVGGMAHF